nr:PREDICTED: ras-related protein Rab-19-like [Rhinolophus sinicus]
MGSPEATPCPPLLQMQVWDMADKERFRTITQSYYHSAQGAIIAYDITRKSTFESVPHWIHEIEKYRAENLVIMLIGNKCDLSEKRQVLFEDACTLAEKHGLLAVLETSAKESKNIDEVFERMARELITRNSLPLSEENAQNNLPLVSYGPEAERKDPLQVLNMSTKQLHHHRPPLKPTVAGYLVSAE